MMPRQKAAVAQTRSKVGHLVIQVFISTYELSER